MPGWEEDVPVAFVSVLLELDNRRIPMFVLELLVELVMNPLLALLKYMPILNPLIMQFFTVVFN